MSLAYLLVGIFIGMVYSEMRRTVRLVSTSKPAVRVED